MNRIREPELMDDPALDEKLHQHALNTLQRFNRIGKSHKILFEPVSHLAKQLESAGRTEPVRVLDIATGIGDIPIALYLEGKKQGLNLEVWGSDFSARSVQFAKSNAKNANANVDFFKLNVIDDEFPKDFDIITSSLFFHHLDEPDIILVLQKMFNSAKQMVLVCDLERSQLNLTMVWLMTRLATTSSVVQYDGPVSVRAAYTVDEMSDLASKAGGSNVEFSKHLPCRYLLKWSRT